MPSNLENRLKCVAANDGRYHINAYRFVYEALDYTPSRLPEDESVAVVQAYMAQEPRTHPHRRVGIPRAA